MLESSWIEWALIHKVEPRGYSGSHLPGLTGQMEGEMHKEEVVKGHDRQRGRGGEERWRTDETQTVRVREKTGRNQRGDEHKSKHSTVFLPRYHSSPPSPSPSSVSLTPFCHSILIVVSRG